MYEDYVLGIDIGGSSVKCGYVSRSGEIFKKSSFLTAGLTDIAVFMEKLNSIIVPALDDGITQIGISCLGIFDASSKCIGGVENLPFLDGVNLAYEIASLHEGVSVHIMNDGNAAALGEYWMGEGMACPCFLCITLGTGIGSCIVLDGKPLLGSHFQSGEIGYSDYSSEADYFECHYSTVRLLEKAAILLGHDILDGMSFVKLVQEKNELCVKLFNEWLEGLSRIIANAILLIDPEKVIIGGGISAQKGWLCDALSEKVQLHLPESFQEKTSIVPARNGNEAALLGAASVFYTINIL
ncbi:MAG: ROK family protein [Lachnospiraceae bacterium]